MYFRIVWQIFGFPRWKPIGIMNALRNAVSANLRHGAGDVRQWLVVHLVGIFMQPIHNAGKIERLKVKDMDLLEMMKKSRSIRKYQQKQIPRTDLDKIVEAGLHAPNAGGGQRSRIVAIHNANLTGKIGKLNMMSFDRDKLLGSHVSDEQPSVIDDPKIKNGFYDAPTVCIIFAQEDFLFSVADAFCIAENMVLEAFSLGIDSCIVSRAEETFTTDYGKQLLQDWKVPETMIARCFVVLGYHEGLYPKKKPRKENRSLIVAS